MFRCQRCRGEFVSPHRTVTKIRRRVYRVNGRESFGHEVVKELDLCAGCSGKVGEPKVVNPDENLVPPSPPVPLVEPEADGNEGLRRFQRRYDRT